MGIKNLSPITPLGAADGTAQAAAVTSSLLYAVPATQTQVVLYRIKFYLKVTRAATTSSTLGALTITFTDASDSVAQSVVALGGTQTGAAGTTNTGNSTVSVLQGTLTVNAKAGTNINFAIAYTSSGATTMQFEYHLAVAQE